MCTVPHEVREEIFYLRVYGVPPSYNHATISDLFSKFGPIKHIEIHGRCNDQVKKDHCYVGFGDITHAMRALDLGRYGDGHVFEVALVGKHFNVSYGLWKNVQNFGKSATFWIFFGNFEYYILEHFQVNFHLFFSIFKLGQPQKE